MAELRPDQQYGIGAHRAGAFNGVDVDVDVGVGVGATTVARPRRRRAG